MTGFPRGEDGEVTVFDAWGQPFDALMTAFPAALFGFFSLSGFLIGRPFLEGFILGQSTPQITPYLRNRFLRLYPVMWLALALVLIRYGTRGSSAGDLLAAFTLTEDYTDHPLSSLVGQAWTLKVELGFYLLLPLTAVVAARALGGRLGREGRRLVTCALAVGVGAASTIYTELATSPDLEFGHSLPVLIVSFMPGVILAALLAGRSKPGAEASPQARWTAAIAFLGGMTVILLGPEAIPPNGILAYSVGAAGMIAPLGLEAYTGHSWRWLNNRPMRWLGARAYPVYVLQLAVLASLYPLVDDTGVADHREAFWLFALITIPVLLGLADLTHRFVERPAHRLRARGSH